MSGTPDPRRAPLAVAVLGALHVSLDGRPVAVTTRRLRTLLAALAMSAGTAVSVDRLAEMLWGEDPPGNARRSLQTYVTRLRGLLGADTISTTPAGYVLCTEPEQVDALRFLRLLDAAAAADDDEAERELLVQALALWQGEPFADLQSPWLVAAQSARLVERIADQLGVDPGPELRRVHADLLKDWTPEPAVSTGRAARWRVAPRQLPAAVDGFVGRDAALKTLDNLIGDGISQATVAVIAGAAGVGKTTLALHWAHQVAHQFPDGQLYVNLRGFEPGGSPMTVAADRLSVVSGGQDAGCPLVAWRVRDDLGRDRAARSLSCGGCCRIRLRVWWLWSIATVWPASGSGTSKRCSVPMVVGSSWLIPVSPLMIWCGT